MTTATVKEITLNAILEVTIIRDCKNHSLEYKGLNHTGGRVKIYRAHTMDGIIEQMKENGYIINHKTG